MLDPLYTAVSWVLERWHTLLALVLDPSAGITWALSIALLVVTIRVLLIPLVVAQVKSQRAARALQPELAELRRRHGTDLQAYGQAAAALQRERGVNPLAGCLPVLLQIPVFIALLHVLRRLAPGEEGLYGWDRDLTQQAALARLLGAPISSSFTMSGTKEQAVLALDGVTHTSIRTVALLLIVVMCVTTFVTQRYSLMRSGPLPDQAAVVQKLLLYGAPLSLFVTGFFFPVGVLLYWTTNNLWTLGQQFVVLRSVPPAAPEAPPGDMGRETRSEPAGPVTPAEAQGSRADRRQGPAQVTAKRRSRSRQPARRTRR